MQAKTLDKRQTPASGKRAPAAGMGAQQVGWALRLLSTAAFLGVWEVLGRRVDPILISVPSRILVALYRSVLSGELATALLSSGGVFVLGFVLSVLLGVGLGVLLGRSKTMEWLLLHYFTALYMTPQVALIPLVILWLGLYWQAKTFIIFLVAFFPILFNTIDGVRNVSRQHMDVVRAYGATEREIVREVVLPAVVPFVMGGIRLGIGRALTGLVVAEMFTAMSGLGAMVVTAANMLQTDVLFVGVVVLGGLGYGMTILGRYLEHRFAPWKQTERAS